MISGILVDTGSSGLRILSSALTISPPQQTGSNGNPIVECFPFVDGITWGPIQTVDMTISGEQAKSLPIQVIGSSNFSTIPDSCTSYGAPEDDLASLGANGILGVGNFAQDCGSACTVSGASNPGLYYTCPASGCEVTAESLLDQVPNPVTLFATDNNGVIIELPPVQERRPASAALSSLVSVRSQITGSEARRSIRSIPQLEISRQFSITYLTGMQAFLTAALLPSISWTQTLRDYRLAATIISGIARLPRRIFLQPTKQRMERPARSISSWGMPTL